MGNSKYVAGEDCTEVLSGPVRQGMAVPML